MSLVTLMYIAAALLTLGAAGVSFWAANRRTGIASVANAVVIVLTSANLVSTTRTVDFVAASGTLVTGVVVLVVAIMALRRRNRDKEAG